MDASDWMILRSTELLASLPQVAEQRLTEGVTPQSFRKKTVLFHQGDRADALYVVLGGWVKLFRNSPNHTETVVGIRRCGDTVGATGIFLEDGHPATAEAITAVRVFPVEQKRLRSLLADEPKFAHRLLSNASRRMQFLMQHIEEMKALSADQRIVSFVLSICSNQSGSCTIALPFEKALISRWLGINPASFSRALTRLRRYGLDVHNESVTVGSIETLGKLMAVSRRSGHETTSSTLSQHAGGLDDVLMSHERGEKNDLT